MGVPLDLNGLRFGKLAAVARTTDNSAQGKARWLCVCECGRETVVRASDLKNGKTKSCGCGVIAATKSRRTKHGFSGKLPEYKVWTWMRDRCQNPKNARYADYGGRGIVVCDRWDDFEAFLADMGRRPSLGHSIDRINNDGNYEPNNCRWATAYEQAANRRPKRRSAA